MVVAEVAVVVVVLVVVAEDELEVPMLILSIVSRIPLSWSLGTTEFN